jgi:hypothetical protein
MGKRPLRSEVGHTQRLLDRQTRAHHLAKDGANRIRRKAPAAFVHESIEHPPLALGIVKHDDLRALLHLCDFARHGRAPGKEVEDVIVERIDALSCIGQGLGRHPCARGGRTSRLLPPLQSHFGLHARILA